MHAYDVMTRKPISISPNALARDALTLLVDKGVSGLTVVDDGDRLVGVISEYALLEVAYDALALQQPVSHFMTRDVISVNEDTPLRELADRFILHRVRRLPVLAHGKLVGLVTRGDVLRYLCRELVGDRCDENPLVHAAKA